MNEGISETWQQAHLIGAVAQGMDVDETTPGREAAEALHARNLDHLNRYVEARRLHVKAHPQCSEAPICSGGVVSATISARSKISGFYRDSLLASAIAELDLVYAALRESAEAQRTAEARLRREEAESRARIAEAPAMMTVCEDLASDVRAYVPVGDLPKA